MIKLVTRLCLLATAALLTISCQKEVNTTVVVNGVVEQPASDSVFLLYNGERKGFALDNGQFKDTLKLDAPVYADFISGRQKAHVFLQPGDSLFISTDMMQFDEALIFAGTSGPENNYLAQKSLKEIGFEKDPESFYSADPVSFKAQAVEFRDQLLDELKESKTSAVFKEMEKKNIMFSYYTSLLQYPMAYEFFTKEKIDMPAEFEKEMSEAGKITESDFLAIPNYRQYVLVRTQSRMENAKTAEEAGDIIKEFDSPIIRDRMMKNLILYRIASASPDSEYYYNLIMDEGSDEELKEEAKATYEKVQNLLAGNPSPKFVYDDPEGHSVALDDLQGNLVYIDVWATWCVPCLNEIPSMKELQEDYKDQNVKFVAISVDVLRDYDKWKGMIQEKDLKGIHLFSDQNWKSDFVQAYGINAIPRFLLIDQNGNIISADAPRPSNPAIRELLDKNLKG